MPILAKTDDVRSGRKANARHGRHRITIQYCLKIDFGICAITDTAFGCARQANHGRRNPGKNLDVLVCQTLSVFFKALLESSLRKASRLLRWDILGENWTLLNQKHKKARERGWRKNHHGGCSSRRNAKSWWTNHGFWRLSGLVNSRTSYRSK